MTLLDDARRLLESPPTYGHEISELTCPCLIEAHEDCHYCDASVGGPRREVLASHHPRCPWRSMPKIVAALEREGRYRAALEHIASFDRKALDMAKTLHYDMNGWAKRALEQPAPEREG